ncbi:MAG: FIG00816486: hypothetical protein, partial [uncultured Solirubrobacteraceae bacterium]
APVPSPRRPRARRPRGPRRSRGRHSRGVRRARPVGLPPAVAERPLHEGRPDHGHRPAPGPAARPDAAQRRGQADRPDGDEPQRRVQPGLDGDHARAGARLREGVRAQRPAADHRPEAVAQPPLARRDHRRDDPQAAAHLGRARVPGRAEEGPGRPDARAASGEEPRRGPALHRRPARPAPRGRQQDRRPRRVRALPRRQGDRGPRQAHGLAVRDAAPSGRQARRSLPRVGLHRRERAQPVRADAVDPRPRVRRARRREPRRPEGGRRVAALRTQPRPARRPAVAGPRPGPRAGRHRERPAVLSRRDRAVRGGGERQAPAYRPRPRPRAVLPLDARLRAGRHVHLRVRRRPPPAARQHRRGAVHVHHPACRAHARAGASRALRPRAARQREPGHRRREPGPRQRARLRLVRHGLERHVERGPAERRDAARRPVALRLAHRPRPAGDAELPLPRPDAHPRRRVRLASGVHGRGQAVDRHAPALLHGREPGRDHGRLAHRGRARLHPRRARRPGHELLDAAAALDRLRHLRAGHVQRVPERARAAARAQPRPAVVGPRRGQRLRAPHDARPVSEHPAARGDPQHGVGRPPGHELGDAGDGAHGRRAAAGTRARAVARLRRRVLRRPDDPELPGDGLAVRRVGRRAAADRRRQGQGNAASARRQHPQPRRGRPPRAGRVGAGERPRAGQRVPAAGGAVADPQRLRRPPVLPRRLDRAV